MAYHDHEAAGRGDGAALRRSLDRLSDGIEQLGGHVGISPFRQFSKQFDITVPPVLHATIAVVGAEGRFTVTLTSPVAGVNRRGGARAVAPRFNPYADDDARVSRQLEMNRYADGRQNGRMLHEVQSALDSNWNANSGVVSYGVSAQLSYVIVDPNVTRVWRVRSRIEGSDFNDFVYFTDPSTCGVIGVYSGTVTSLGLSLVNQAATTSTGTSPLTQSGTSTLISVAASTWKYGSLRVSYNSGSVDPGGYGTYFVYAKDQKRAGGAVTYLATTDVSEITGADDVIYFGVITTAGGGGGAGTGGGSGGGCCIDEVEVDMADGSKKPYFDLRKGDAVLSPSGQIERLTCDPELISGMPCFSLEFENKIVLRGASSTHDLKFAAGPIVKVFDIHVGDILETVLGPSKVVRKTYIGERTVAKIHLDNERLFITDGVVSHNKMPV